MCSAELRQDEPPRGHRKRMWVAATAVCLALVLLWVWHTRRKYQSFIEQRTAFLDLAELANAMIREHAAGVSDEQEGPFISSFDAFFDYVAAKRPHIVSDRNAPNPFPGLLPSGEYGRMQGRAKSGSELLFWSRDTHHRPIGRVQMKLTCAGRVKTIDSVAETAR